MHAYAPLTPTGRRILIQTNLDGADLATAVFDGADLSGASLLGTDLGEVDLATVTIQGAIYDSFTTWPAGFDFEEAGAVSVEDASTAPFTDFDCVAPGAGGSQE